MSVSVSGMRPTWGDTVQIKAGAHPEMRPGALGAVCGTREIEPAGQASQFSSALGSTVYLVEFGDGTSLEVPEAWVELA
jgi:hypothetical protein